MTTKVFVILIRMGFSYRQQLDVKVRDHREPTEGIIHINSSKMTMAYDRPFVFEWSHRDNVVQQTEKQLHPTSAW